MKVYTFNVKEHREYGSLGFAPSWYPSGDPLGGMAVAHDILEHFPKDDGSAEGEFMALGASLWIRGEAGYYSNGTPEENVASDFPLIFDVVNYQSNCPSFRTPPRHRADEHVEELADNVLQKASKLLREEREISIHQTDRDKIARWLTYGYVKAYRRYKAIDRHFSPYEVCYSLFKPIQDKADNLLKVASEGMQLQVKVNYKQLDVQLTLDYMEDLYYA